MYVKVYLYVYLPLKATHGTISDVNVVSSSSPHHDLEVSCMRLVVSPLPDSSPSANHDLSSHRVLCGRMSGGWGVLISLMSLMIHPQCSPRCVEMV